MSDNMTTNLELIMAYFKALEDEEFYGTIEVTLQAGNIAYTRELQSKQAHEIAAEAWESLSDSSKKELLKNQKLQNMLLKKK